MTRICVTSRTKGMITLTLLIFFAVIIQTCASQPQAVEAAAPVVEKKTISATAVTYSQSIAPIMEASCAPCHYPEHGKKKLLDTYEATVETIDDIIYRIQLPADSAEFMPYKSKRPPLDTQQIALFKRWLEQGLQQ